MTQSTLNYFWINNSLCKKLRHAFSWRWKKISNLQMRQQLINFFASTQQSKTIRLTWSWRTIWPTELYYSCWIWCLESTFSARLNLDNEPRRTLILLFANALVSMSLNGLSLKKIDLDFVLVSVYCCLIEWKEKFRI